MAWMVVVAVVVRVAAEPPAARAAEPAPAAVTEPGPARFRTPWGDPDLQGIWSNATLTPLERPDKVQKEYYTEEEAAEIDRTGFERTLAPIQFEVRASGELTDTWMELGKGVRSRRTSLVVDPPNGKVPYTAAGLDRRNLAIARLLSLVPIDSWEDRGLNERCLLTGGLFVPNPFYLNNHQIFQTPDHVAIKSEVMNEVRIIPMDGRRPPDPAIGMWAGASRGRWEGESLVVEVSNYNDKGGLAGSTSGLRLHERFTRVDADTIDYELTVTDPASYTQPWKLANTLRRIEGPIYEYACHEGNYSLVNILAGARAKEAREEEKRNAEQPRDD
jgi:hypothetical protein